MNEIKVIPQDKLIIRKSTSMFFAGGEIFFLQLDALSVYTELVTEKFLEDMKLVSRPSMTSDIAVNLNETLVTDEMCKIMADSFCAVKKPLHKVCFVGLDKDSKRTMKKAFKEHGRTGFAVNFIDDYEKAKEWLVGERQ